MLIYSPQKAISKVIIIIKGLNVHTTLGRCSTRRRPPGTHWSDYVTRMVQDHFRILPSAGGGVQGEGSPGVHAEEDKSVSVTIGDEKNHVGRPELAVCLV